jgi:hypothetical protein
MMEAVILIGVQGSGKPSTKSGLPIPIFGSTWTDMLKNSSGIGQAFSRHERCGMIFVCAGRNLLTWTCCRVIGCDANH